MSNPVIIYEDQPFYVTKERVGKGEYYRVYQNTGTHAVVVASIGVNMSESWNRVLKAISDRKGKENPLIETGKLPLYDSLQEVTAAYPSFRIMGTKTSALEAARRSPTPSHVAGWKQPRNSEGEGGSLVVWGYAPGEYGEMDTRKTNPMERAPLDETSSRLLKQAMKVGVVTDENKNSVFLVQEAITRLDNGKYRPAHLAEAIQYAQGSPNGDPIANLRDHLSQGYGINTITGERESLAYRGGDGYEDAIAKRARSILEALSYMEKSNPKFKSVRDYKIEKLADRIKQLSHEIGYPLSQDRAELVAEIYVQDTPLNLEDVEKVPNEHLDWRIKERYEEDSNLRKWTEEDRERRRAAGYRVENPSYRPSQSMEHEVNLTDKETGVKYRALVKVSWNKKYYSIDNGDSWFSSTKEMKQKQPDWYAVAIKLADPTITGEIRLPSGGSVNKIKNPAQRFRDHYALGKAAAAKLPKNMREYPSSWEYKWKNKGREYEEKLDKQGYKPGIAEYPFNEFMEGLRDALYESATGAKQFAVYGFRESGNYRNEMPVSPMVFDSASKARRWKQENLTEDEIYRGGPEGRGFVVREYYGQDMDKQHIARLDERGRLSNPEQKTKLKYMIRRKADGVQVEEVYTKLDTATTAARLSYYVNDGGVELFEFDGKRYKLIATFTNGNHEEPEMRKSNPYKASRIPVVKGWSDKDSQNLLDLFSDRFNKGGDYYSSDIDARPIVNTNKLTKNVLAYAKYTGMINRGSDGRFHIGVNNRDARYTLPVEVLWFQVKKGMKDGYVGKSIRAKKEVWDLLNLYSEGERSYSERDRSEQDDILGILASHGYIYFQSGGDVMEIRERVDKPNPRWSTRETGDFLDAAAKRYVDSGEWDAISTANQIRYGFHKYVLNEMGTADRLGMTKARAMKLFGQECRRLIRQLFNRPKPNPKERYNIYSGFGGQLINSTPFSTFREAYDRAQREANRTGELMHVWSDTGGHSGKGKKLENVYPKQGTFRGSKSNPVIHAGLKSFVTKTDGKIVPVKNLGWILRNWQNIERMSWVSGTDNPMVDGVFQAYLTDGSVYTTAYSDKGVFEKFINRPVFKGLKINVDGQERTIGESGLFSSRSNPTSLNVSSLSLDEAYEELDKIRRWIVNDGSKYEGLDREQRSRRIGQLVQSGIKKDMEALAAKYPELKEVWGQYNNTPTAESAISQLFTLGADQYDFISPTRRESNPSLAPALSSLSSLDPSMNLENDSYHAASAVSEMFHGRPVKEDVTVMEQVFEHDNYAQLGTLHKLIFLAEPKSSRSRTVSEVTLQFPDPDAAVSDVVRLCADPEGRTLYFIGGDQSVDLDELGFTNPRRIKDLIVLGTLVQIEYFSDKAFDKFQTINYYHQLGEETKKFPILLYDTHNSTLKLAGGDYSIEDRGIVN